MSLQYKVISKFYRLLDFIYFKDTESNPRKRLLDYIPNKKLRVLEVCVGTAENSIVIAESRKDTEIVGIDLSKEMLAIANEKINQKSIKNISTKVMDATNMSFEDRYFDIVVISLVLHELDSGMRDKVMKETSRVLKETGNLIVLEWDNNNLSSFTKRFLFSIINSLEPKYFKDFMKLDMKEYGSRFNLNLDSEKKCDYTKVIRFTKSSQS